MKINQSTAVLEDAQDTFADMAALLAGKGINILACSLKEDMKSGDGDIQMIVNDTENGIAILAENGFEVSCSEVVVAETPDKPGGLAKVLQSVKDTGQKISQLYAFS